MIGRRALLTLSQEKHMFKRIFSLVLAALALNLACAAVSAASTKAEREARFAAQVRAEIAKLGTGPAARVEVKLRDKTKLRGYVGAAGDDQFVVVNDQTGAATTVIYPQIRTVKGNNLSTGVKIAIGVAVVIVIALLLAPHVAQ
jgi:hypothetical protein